MRRPNVLRAGVVTLASVLILILVAMAINVSFGLPFNLSLLPPGQDYAVKAAFIDGNGVNRGADVVIAGHTVGQVTGVEISGMRAVVTMRVASRYAPLHQFSTARIRYSTLLAQKYIEITPRDGGAELKSGAAIQSENTLSPVDFDQFLSALDPETRARLQTLIQQAGGGLQAQLNGLSQESVAPLKTFHEHDPDLDRIVANLGVTSDRLAQSHQQLGDLVASMGAVTGTLAQNDQSLRGLLTHMGNVMGDFDATLAGNEQNFHTVVVTLDPLLSELNGTLTIVAADTHSSIGAINTNNRQLQPELVSAVSQTDAAGQHLLRQYYVVNPACDQVSAQPNPQCQTGTGQAAQNVALPTLPLPSLPKLPLPKCLPTPSPPKLPTPTLSPLPCPSVSAPTAPTVPCVPAPTAPPKLPTPSPSLSVCPSVPGLVPPLGILPDWLSILLFGAPQ
jgi:phospholipid/cholesterol/gamma-HCH transport system substrate-binding protein